MTARDNYPLPLVDALLSKLLGCRWFAKIDLKTSFNLLRVAHGHGWKTAFKTPWGLYEYLVMPFGLANAPACFQRLIQSILSEYLDVFCYVYIDDILIFSKTRQEHTDHVTKTLSKLQDHGLFPSAEKCCFYQQEVTFLGFIVSTTGLRMDPAKLDTIAKWPYPQNIRKLYRFLGFTNFYR